MDLEAHRPFLKSLAYRMTGTVADADDVVQEAFTRTLLHPPKDLSRPLRPWLVRVTMNVARDQLRRRRRTTYVGPWLPGVVDEEALDRAIEDNAVDDKRVEGADVRYSRKESVTFAFLLALEALTPVQRAVLVLREVFDFSGHETAAALGISDDNAKTILSRAKKALRAYDEHRAIPDEDRLVRDGAALQRFFTALANDDVDEALSLLRDDCVALSDGGGVFQAARVPLVGPQRVMTVFKNLMRLWKPGTFEIAIAVINALPAIVLRSTIERPGQAPLWVLRVDTDDDGRIAALHSVGAPSKLVGL